MGLAVAVPMGAHVVLNWPWVVAVVRKAIGALPAMTRVDRALNAVPFVAMVVAITSGLMISRVATPGMALVLGTAPAWADVHAASADAAVAIVTIHDDDDRRPSRERPGRLRDRR